MTKKIKLLILGTHFSPFTSFTVLAVLSLWIIQHFLYTHLAVWHSVTQAHSSWTSSLLPPHIPPYWGLLPSSPVSSFSAPSACRLPTVSSTHLTSESFSLPSSSLQGLSRISKCHGSPNCLDALVISKSSCPTQFTISLSKSGLPSYLIVPLTGK